MPASVVCRRCGKAGSSHRRRACLAIRFRHHQHVTNAQEFETFFQAVALGDAADLLGKRLLSAGGGEVAFLRGKPAV
jgi:hypothetical protein